jgi:hypothetical protein
VKKRRRIRWFCDDAAVGNASIPADKLLNTTGKSSGDGFMNIPEGTDEEIPF